MEVKMGSKTDEIIENHFESRLQRYEEELEESMKESEFVFDNVYFLYYKLYKISLNHGGSYIDSGKWLNNKKATTNLKQNYGKCFQYATTLALSYQKIKNYPERISKIESFINQYDWKEREFPSHKKHEKNE